MNADRIVARLWKAEQAEHNPHMRGDIRQASIIVAMCSRGEANPLVQSSYKMFGLHPDNVFPAWLAQQKAKLGKEFSDWYDAAGNRKPDIPKKTSAPVTPHPDEQVSERLAAVIVFPKKTA